MSIQISVRDFNCSPYSKIRTYVKNVAPGEIRYVATYDSHNVMPMQVEDALERSAYNLGSQLLVARVELVGSLHLGVKKI